MNILITGSNGFIGSNLVHNLLPLDKIKILNFSRESSPNSLEKLVLAADRIVHLAGVNRPQDLSEFDRSNSELTAELCKIIEFTGRKIPIIFASSTQAELDSPYGLSKLKCEILLKDLAQRHRNSVTVYRLPGIFGKWCKPNYNNVVGTFCHNIAHGLPIDIHDANKLIQLTYIDDLIENFIDSLFQPSVGLNYKDAFPVHTITIGELAHELYHFKKLEGTNNIPDLGTPLNRALYSTFLSYLPISKSTYMIDSSADNRGIFVEVLKHPNAGQISFLTAKPGVTRGGHFHHSKVEKFLVVKGLAKFRFSHVVSNEKYEITTSEIHPQIVQTLPGWAHDITNIGNEEMIAIVWSNEAFNPFKPDTIKLDTQ